LPQIRIDIDHLSSARRRETRIGLYAPLPHGELVRDAFVLLKVPKTCGIYELHLARPAAHSVYNRVTKFPVEQLTDIKRRIAHFAAVLLGATLTARAILCAAILAASCLLLASPSPSHPFDQLGGMKLCLIETLLLSILSFVARWFPAAGPKFGEKVSMVPFAGVVALLILPPGLAVVPVLVAGILALAADRDPDERSYHVDHCLVLVASLLCACAAVNAIQVNQAGVVAAVPASKSDLFRADVAAVALYGAAYLAGMWLMIARGASAAVRAVPRQRRWRVYWFNEAVVYLIGSPIVLLVAAALLWFGPIAGTLVLLSLSTLTLLVTRALVDGKMVRRQLYAMDKLTQQAAIGKSPSTQRFLTDFLELSSRLIIYDRATVWLNNEHELVLEKNLEYVGKSIAFQPCVRRSGEDIVGRVAERSKPILVDDSRKDARHRHYQLSDAQKRAMGRISVMAIPLLASGELVGVVEFLRHGAPGYARQDCDRMQSLAGLVAMCLANNRLHQDVILQAVTDGLTGLYNKRQILKSLADEAARAQRYDHSLSVMMLDLDGFKMFNDTYGHMQGDLLLQCLAGLIKQSIRATDIAGRYGGEEFIVVMPETGREAAWVTAERIRAHVEAEQFIATINYEAPIGNRSGSDDNLPHHVGVHKTISIGVATYPVDALDPQALLARADEALYSAKNAGRNRVVVAGFPVESQPRTMAGV
jgi:diguanylate cyclase (GGDEF)-like protein